jgi:hypothetical protein
VPDLISCRHIYFANVTSNELEEQLAQACELASFGLNDEDILDELTTRPERWIRTFSPRCFKLYPTKPTWSR